MNENNLNNENNENVNAKQKLNVSRAKIENVIAILNNVRKMYETSLNEYSVGLYNGISFAISMIEEKEANYLTNEPNRNEKIEND